MKYTGVIFDLDGVICSTDEYHFQAWKRMADRRGIYFDREINNRLRGVSRMASLDIILERAQKSYSDEEKLEMATEKNDTYRKLLGQMSPADLPEDVSHTLKTLKEHGVKIAIGSSSKNTKTILERLKILDWFDAISDGNNITHSKPDPEVFVKAAEMLDLQPAQCLVVEDAKSGITAAVNGGFDGAGIGEAAEHEQVTYPIEKISDILAHVL